MKTRLAAAALLLFFVVLSGCSNGPSGSGAGATCVEDADCASGLCIDDESWDGTSYCSVSCAGGAACPSVSGHDFFFCDGAAGHCFFSCIEGPPTRGSGATTEMCQGDHYVACSTLDDAVACDDCGCEPFGGGTCVPGSGCVVPQPDGTACTRDVECTSGTCYRDTDVCGPPRATGEPCSVDAECATSNCSTDGDETMVGHCNQALGSACTAPTNGHTPTATCNDCHTRFGASSGVCLRSECDPVDADHCPSFSGHDFDCARSADGGYFCFEVCEDELDTCYYDTVFCYRAGDYCR